MGPFCQSQGRNLVIVDDREELRRDGDPEPLHPHAATTIFFGLNEMPGRPKKKAFREIRYNGRGSRLSWQCFRSLLCCIWPRRRRSSPPGKDRCKATRSSIGRWESASLAGDWRLLDDPPEVTRTPGYPVLRCLFPVDVGRWGLAAAIVTQHLLLLGIVAVTAWTCWRLTGRHSAVALCLALSLACFSCWGVAVNLLSDTLLSFLLTLASPSPPLGGNRRRDWKAAALGLALGAAVLTKPVAQFAGLIAVGWMLPAAAAD